MKVPRGLKTANRAIVSDSMSILGFMLFTLKLTAKPQLIQPRSRPQIQSCDISTNNLDRKTYRKLLIHIFSDTFSSVGSCSKVTDPQFLSSGFKLLTVNDLMDYPDPVILCHLVGMCPRCLQGSHMIAAGKSIVFCFCVTL